MQKIFLDRPFRMCFHELNDICEMKMTTLTHCMQINIDRGFTGSGKTNALPYAVEAAYKGLMV